MRSIALLFTAVSAVLALGCDVATGLRPEKFATLFRGESCQLLTECGVHPDLETCREQTGPVLIDNPDPRGDDLLRDCPCYDPVAANECFEALRTADFSCDLSAPSVIYPEVCTRVCCREECQSARCDLAQLSGQGRCDALLAGFPDLLALTAEAFAAATPDCSTVPLGLTSHPDARLDPKEPEPAVTAQLTYFARVTELVAGATVFDCGPGQNGGLVLCADEEVELTAPAVVLAYQTEQPLILDDPKNLYELGFTFDADGNALNNFEPPLEFENDLFENTDRWYSAHYSPNIGWSMQVRTVEEGEILDIPSAARILLRGSTAVVVVPASELTSPDPPARISLFRHDGSFGLAEPNDWSGQAFPAQHEPLLRRVFRLPF